MSSRISIARPQAGGYSPDPHGIGNSRPSSGYRAANPENPIEQLQYYAKQIEDYVEIYSQPLRPYLPAIGRFLIIVTFLEDSLRIVTQWGDQLWYLQKYVSFSPFLDAIAHNFLSSRRHRHFPGGISHLFLFINVIVCPPSPPQSYYD
jgi:ER-derived vesicles protein